MIDGAVEAGGSLLPARVLEGLSTRFVGREVAWFAEIGSTNDEAGRLAEAGAPEGTLVIAEYQTAGRGRLSRCWEAPVGSSLLLSLVFRPDWEPHRLQWLTMICGLAVLDAVQAQTGLQLMLKWPNDIVLGAAKLGGILAEAAMQGDRLNHVVVGIGVNVNVDVGTLPAGLLMPATSLSQQLGMETPRLPLLKALLVAVEARYLRSKTGHSPRDEWAAHLVTLGQCVRVTSAGIALDGIAESVDDDGALQIRLHGGQLTTIRAGDVMLRKREDLCNG